MLGLLKLEHARSGYEASDGRSDKVFRNIENLLVDLGENNV
ncbi:MAG: hypothetical protein R6V84_06015 [Desulfobacterales bacterium]